MIRNPVSFLNRQIAAQHGVGKVPLLKSGEKIKIVLKHFVHCGIDTDRIFEHDQGKLHVLGYDRTVLFGRMELVKFRIQPLVDHVIGRSDETGLPKYDEPLFCNRTGGRLTYDGASDAMEDYFKHRCVKWCGFHKFRYSYATFWIRDGGNPLLLKEQLGHSSLAMTNRYVLMTGIATKAEAEQHSLIKKVPEKTGRKAIKIKK